MKSLHMSTIWNGKLLTDGDFESFSAFLSRLSILCLWDQGVKCVHVLCVFEGGYIYIFFFFGWAVERWESLLSKGPRTKQETIPLFWLVVATSVWNFEEVNSHVMFMSVLRSEHAHTNTSKRTLTHSAGNVWHASISRDTKTWTPCGCYEEPSLNRLNTLRDDSVTLVEYGLLFFVGQSAPRARVFKVFFPQLVEKVSWPPSCTVKSCFICRVVFLWRE